MADELTIMEPGDLQPYEQGGMGIEESRAMAETQAGFIIAKRYPRDVQLARQNILRACESLAVAEGAEFSFPKGGGEVRGPTIKLLEVIGQAWGNIIAGIRELEVRESESVLMSYCYDLETNRREERIFTVRHQIMLKGGAMKKLIDPRELYEHAFNMGSRRERACMEKVIPRWIVDEAIEVCRETINTKGEPPNEENIGKMLEAFAELNVTEEMIERRLQKKLKAITSPEFAALKRIHRGIDQGMSTAESWFGEETLTQPKKKEPAKKKTAAKKKAPAKKKAADPPPGDTQKPTPTTAATEGGDQQEPPKDDAPPPPEPNAFEKASAPKPAPGPEELPLGGEMAEPSDTTITDRLEVVKFIKDGVSPSGNPWSLYHVETMNGSKLACFDKNLVARAEEALDQGQLCQLEFRKTPKGLNLIDVTVIG